MIASGKQMIVFDSVVCLLYNNGGRIYRRNTLYSALYLMLHAKLTWRRGYYMPLNDEIINGLHSTIVHNHVTEGNLFGQETDLFYYELSREGLAHHEAFGHDCGPARAVLCAGRRICGLRPEPMQAAAMIHYAGTDVFGSKYAKNDVRLARLITESIFGNRNK